MTSSLHPFAAGLDHPEGVAWDPEGYLVAGGEAGQLWRIPIGDGDPELVAETGGFCLGIALDADHRVYVCDMGRSEVVVADPESGAVRTYSSGTPEHPMRVPNFLVFDSDGRLYVTDSGTHGASDGRIYSIEPDGTTRLASTDAPGFPNGLALDAAGEFLYVVETSLPGVCRLPRRPDGSLGPRETVLALPAHVPDGLALCADGSLLISCYRPDLVYRWDGTTLHTVASDPTGLTLSAPTNVAFFGAALDRLCTANLAGWHLTEIQTDLVGQPLHRPRLPN
jgi:gluconolactonase